MSCRGVEKLGPGGLRMGGGGCWGIVVFGEGSGLGGGQGSESGMPRGYKTWKLPQRLFHPELR